MDHTTLLQTVYEVFTETGRWPLVRDLQRRYRDINVRLLAAEIGHTRVVCREGTDGQCSLTLPGIAACNDSGADLANFAAAVRVVGRHASEHGSAQISGVELNESLRLSPLELERVGAMLYLSNTLWKSGSWPDGSGFFLEPSEAALFFEDVADFSEYLAQERRVADEARRTAELNTGRWARALGSRNAEPDQDRGPMRQGPRLLDPDLDAVFASDFNELALVQAVGAWKAAGILAGACLEALLLDLWKRDEAEARRRFKHRWPDRVPGGALANQAVAAGLLPADFLPLATLLRRRRNLVHPGAALHVGETSEELAQTLVSLLRYVVASVAEAPSNAQASAPPPKV